MSDGQYAPLSSAVVRSLTDKVYEKRKAAALDVERQVRDLFQTNQLPQLERVLAVLAELVGSSNTHQRKGGLIGMAAAAIALGNKNVGPYTDKLIEPVLPCFNDPDLQIRYYACESLYNICKISRANVVSHFENIFDVLWRVTADTDQNVRGGAELLDRLLMDIVIAKEDFDVAILMSLIRDRIYSQTTSNRKFIVNWLSTIQSTPYFSIIPYVPEVADGLLKMLSDSAPGVRDITESVLAQFLTAIRKKPSSLSQDDFIQMINVLIVHAHENEPMIARRISVIWLDEFLALYGSQLLPLLSNFLVGILPVINQTEIKGAEVNKKLMHIVSCNKLPKKTLDDSIEVLLNLIGHERMETRLQSLNWIRLLHSSDSAQTFLHMHRIFPVLLKVLSDTSDEVLLLDLLLISTICQSEIVHDKIDVQSFGVDVEMMDKLTGVSPFLVKFAISLLEMFRQDSNLLNERGVLIIRQLCLLLEPAHIYRTLCVLLEREQKAHFVQAVVSTLHGVLLTATELFELRDSLRYLADQQIRDLFVCVFRVWCCRPIALLGLCLLSQHYEQAAMIALMVSKVDITVDVLVEIDKLTNLIESPVLAYVRMDLLSSVHRTPLCTVLSALLMLLPQSDAFVTLHKRMQAVPALVSLNDKKLAPAREVIDFGPLMEHFEEALGKRQKEIRDRHRDLLSGVVGHMKSLNV